MNFTFRKALLIYTLLPIVVTYVVFAIFNLVTIKNETHRNIEKHMTDLAASYAGMFDSFLKPIEGVSKTNARLIEESDNPTIESIYRLLELQVENNPVVYGAAFAFMPGQFDPDVRLFAPYVYKKDGKMIHMDIAQEGYEYTDSDWEWWNYPAATNKPHWSEPYFDKGAGNILMSSYSYPFFKNGKFWGVATADIPLQKISNKIHIPGIKGHSILVLSDTGKIILHPETENIGENIHDFINHRFDAAQALLGDESDKRLDEIKYKLEEFVAAMMSGDSGKGSVAYFDSDERHWLFYAPIPSVGWSLSMGVKESEIFKVVNEQLMFSVLFFCVLLLFIISSIVIVSGKFSNALQRLIKRSQRIERLNFQTTGLERENIAEIRQLSHTLNNMCEALNSHFTVQDETRIAGSIREHSLPQNNHVRIKGFDVVSQSNAGREQCKEFTDLVVFRNMRKHSIDAEQVVNNLGLLVIDDCDSDIEATVKGGHLRAIYRTLMKQNYALNEIAKLMNRYLFEDMNLSGPVQLWMGKLDDQHNKLNSISMGQINVFHFAHARGEFNALQNLQPALRTDSKMHSIQVQEISLSNKDVVVVTSDGVSGALNQQREQFGASAIENIIRKHAELSVVQLSQTLQAELQTFTGKGYMNTERSFVIIKNCNEEPL